MRTIEEIMASITGGRTTSGTDRARISHYPVSEDLPTPEEAPGFAETYWGATPSPLGVSMWLGANIVPRVGNMFLKLLDELADLGRLGARTAAVGERTYEAFAGERLFQDIPSGDYWTEAGRTLNPFMPSRMTTGPEGTQALEFTTRTSPTAAGTNLSVGFSRWFGNMIGRSEEEIDHMVKINTLGGFTTGGYMPLAMRGIPESPEESADYLRIRGRAGVAIAEATGKMGLPGSSIMRGISTAMPWAAGIWNRAVIAEIIYDPLILIGELKAATKLANTVRGIPRVTKMLETIGESPLYQAVHETLWKYGGAEHEMWGTARKYYTRGESAKLQSIKRQVQFAEELQTTAGVEYGRLAPQMTDLIETGGRSGTGMPEWVRVVRGATGETATAYERDAITQARKLVSQTPGLQDLPEEAQSLIGKRLWESLLNSKERLEWERMNKIPTPELSDDLGYVMRAYTDEARKTIQRGMKQIPKPGDYVLPPQIAATMHSRGLRATVKEINEAAANGLVWVDPEHGIQFLTPQTATEAAAKGWEQITGKVLIDDPAMLEYLRLTRSVNAVNAAKFLEEISGKYGKVTGEGEGMYTLRNVMGELNWRRTFGRLTDEVDEVTGKITTRNAIKELSDTIDFGDQATASAVLRYTNLLFGIQRTKTPALALYDKILSGWRAITLTPFAPYHMRNFVGNIINNDLAGISPLAYIDAAFISRTDPELLKEMAELGVFRHGQVSRAAINVMDDGTIAPFHNTVLGSRTGAKKAMAGLNPFSAESYGMQIGSSIENNARAAHYIHMRRSGKTAQEALESVNKYLFDYMDIPDWMQASKRFLAFPTWTMKNIPVQLEHLFTTPAKFGLRGRLMASSRAAAGEDWRDKPSWIEEGGGFAVPSLDPDRPTFFRPENFDPAATLSELVNPMRMAYEMLNPFVTEPVGQAYNWDTYFQKQIVRDYDMRPEAVQRSMHVIKSFFRFYNEIDSLLRAARTGEDPTTIASRKAFGVPMFAPDPNTTIHFNLRDNQDKIDVAQRHENLDDLRTLYMQKLALLGHRSYAQIDPFTGEQRDFQNVDNPDNQFDIAGRKTYYQEALQTCMLLLTGMKSTAGEKVYHDPLLAEGSPEQEFVIGLMNRILDTYTMDITQSIRGGEDVGENPLAYPERTREALGGR